MWENCSVCGRKLKKINVSGQLTIGDTEQKRICGNCVNRIKYRRLQPVILEMTGQQKLI